MFFVLKFILILSFFTTLSYGNQLFELTDEIGKLSKRMIIRKEILYVCIIIIMFFIHPTGGVLSIAVVAVYLFSSDKMVKKNKQRVIEFNGYKIFKFLLNQVSSGISVSDGIKSMYRIVDDNSLKNCLIEVAAYYSKTTDLTASLLILKTKYKSLEVDTLCMAIEQGIYTGANYETLKKMESLLFKRYINQIKLETKWRKKRSILSVLLLCSIMILMIAIPVIIDMSNAFNQIFLY